MDGGGFPKSFFLRAFLVSYWTMDLFVSTFYTVDLKISDLQTDKKG